MTGMSNERFAYRGPATIGGVPLPVVHLRETTGPDEILRSWSGRSSFPVAEAPEGFPSNLDTNGPATVELPDGRTGTVLLEVGFDGRSWTVDMTGTGPAPR
jgi:hypothetical protein